MKKNIQPLSLFLPAICAVIAMACNKDRDAERPLRPADHIAASERLSIPPEIELPANLPSGNSRTATFYAEGVQKYKAQVKTGTAGILEWVLVAPRASLFDISNQAVGTHGAGPYWALSVADSIFAQPFTPARVATPDTSSIPWLLLMPKNGKTPSGRFADVSYIQRIATRGGKAPATAPLSLADTADVFYTAIYRFTRKN